MEEYETLGDFLEHVSLVMDNDSNRDGEKVTIMTMHAAKGLEFDNVFLPGWEEGVFPSQRALDEGGLASLRGGTPPSLCRDHAGAAALHDPARRKPADLRAVDQFDPLALYRGTAGSAYRPGNHAYRRRIAVARELERERRSLRPCRRGIALPVRRTADRAGSGLYRPVTTPRPKRLAEPGRSAASYAAKPRGDIALGARVFHDKFGYGEVIGQEGNKLEIEFETSGRKRVIDSFVQLAD